MPLKARLKTIEGIDDSLQALYKEVGEGNDKSYVLDVEKDGDWELVNTSGLTSALSKERQNVKELKKKLEAFGDLEPDAAQEALKKIEEMKNWKPDDKVQEQIDSAKRQLIEQHRKELAAREAEAKDLEAQLKQLLVTDQARKSLEKHGAKSTELLLPHVEKRAQMDRHNGTFRPVVKGNDGHERIRSDGSPFTIDDLVAEMKSQDEFSVAFSGSGASGGGAESGKPAGGDGSGSARRAVQITRQEASDVATYRAKKAEAEKAGVELEFVD